MYVLKETRNAECINWFLVFFGITIVNFAKQIDRKRNILVKCRAKRICSWRTAKLEIFMLLYLIKTELISEGRLLAAAF